VPTTTITPTGSARVRRAVEWLVVGTGAGDEEHNPADPFVQPTGAADAYSVGDRVTFEGKVYESTIDANVWSPSAYPAGWKKL
jgi:hypothetical protein